MDTKEVSDSPPNAGSSLPADTMGGPTVAAGFLAAVVMWLAWFGAHKPGFVVPPAMVGVLLLVLQVAATAWFASKARSRRLLIGAGAGLLTGTINLLVLGSILVEQPAAGGPAPGATGLRPSALVFVPGFLAASTAIGLAGGFVGAVIGGRANHGDPGAWLHRFALVAVGALAPLLISGGAVTSTKSAMAVPDWPGTYGANMFLYPISLMSQPTRPQIFYEHSHRLLGALVGLTTIVLAGWVIAARPSRRALVLGPVLVVLVGLQGIMGGLRVEQSSELLAVIHGVLAQVVVALAVGLSCAVDPRFLRPTVGAADPGDRRRARLTTGLLHAALLQLVLGATYRHLKEAPDIPAAISHSALGLHGLFSLAVLIMAMLAGVSLRAGAGPRWPGQRAAGTWLIAVTVLQFVLGWVTLWAVLTYRVPGPPPGETELEAATAVPWPRVVIATFHQANGALLLAWASYARAWAKRSDRRR